jgi:putative flippase GtrA
MSGTTPSHAHAVPRFVLVGCANLVVSLSAFYLCYRYLPLGAASSMQGAVANVLSYAAGMLNSFVLNRIWTFRAGEGRVGTQAWRFTLVNLVSLAGSTLVVHALVDRLHWPELGVWIPLAALIMVANYVGMKYWAFATRREAQRA